MTKNKSTYTGIAGIRKGFEYQDAQAIDLFIRWLMNSQLYRWVKLEADEYGYLDDIVACRNDETIECIQVKYTLHPDAPKTNWTWEDLIESNEKKPSLLKKWFDSWKTIKTSHENVEVIIVTNRSPTGSLYSTVEPSSEGYFKVNLKRLKSDKEFCNNCTRITVALDTGEMIWFNFEKKGSKKFRGDMAAKYLLFSPSFFFFFPFSPFPPSSSFLPSCVSLPFSFPSQLSACDQRSERASPVSHDLSSTWRWSPYHQSQCPSPERMFVW